MQTKRPGTRLQRQLMARAIWGQLENIAMSVGDSNGYQTDLEDAGITPDMVWEIGEDLLKRLPYGDDQ